MKKCVLALAVVSASGLVPQAFAHELAYSKKDDIKVEVPGEATTWCKPDVELTLVRPVWDNPTLLNGLLSKLPVILTKDCAAARVTWKAVDANGSLYANGAGNATNLGVVTLAAAPVAAAPQAAAPKPVEPPAVPAPTPAPAATPAPVAQPAVVVEPQAPAPVIGQPAAPAPKPVVEGPAAPAQPAAPVAQAAPVSADYGRSLVINHPSLIQISDASGCKWVIGKAALDNGDSSLAFTSTPAMPCPASGFAEGSFDRLRWSIPNTYRGDNWNRVYAHGSGLLFNQRSADAVKDKALSYLSPKADQALFLLGELPARQMKVYLAFQRGTYGVLGPFNNDPYYVVITGDERFALDVTEYKRAALEIFQLIKATSPSTTSQENLFIAKSFEALYPVNGWGDDKDKIVRSRIGENRGQFFFDVQDGTNYAARREEQRKREERRVQEQQAQVHTQVLARYEQLKAGMKEFEGRETQALAGMAGIQVRFDSPLALQNPDSSRKTASMMVHVTGKIGDYVEIDFPAHGRLVSDVDLKEAWYVFPVANMTPYLPLEDGRAIPTFRVYSVGEPQACQQDLCADQVSFGAVLAKEFPGAGIDFNWTPDVSQQYVNAWKSASAQIW
ncbi:hypothetical protein EGJ27_24265 [Pseudomonas sp. v388]|uniref:hypothetical protein n=1 Tax=Pseudomonas sp. v388 TaxID=2479849 RepID=UPI000F795C08|nr:hypothetical protein [Pseudomonas sp. v388]RRV03745.1 hypothetical protein EGJ27_24265 [Pseudomonas sp. v388]